MEPLIGIAFGMCLGIAAVMPMLIMLIRMCRQLEKIKEEIEG